MDWKLLLSGLLFIVAGILYRMFMKKETSLVVNETQALVPTNKIQVMPDLSPETKTDLATLRDNFSVNKGKFATWLQITRSQRNTRLIEVLTENELAIIEHGAVIEKAVRDKERSELEYLRFLQEHRYELMELKTKEYILEEATRNFLPVADYVEVRKEELLTDIRIKEFVATQGQSKKQDREYEDLKHTRDLEKSEAESKRKLYEYEERARIDLEKEVKEAEAKLLFKMKASHISRHMKIDLIQDEIEIQYIKIAETKESTSIPAAAKPDIIASRQRIIDKWVKEQDEVQ